jgi:hypothetical protein
MKNGSFGITQRTDLTRTSSAAATESAAGNLWNCFSHKECGRTAGSRRLQRLVRPNHSQFADKSRTNLLQSERGKRRHGQGLYLSS